MHVGRYIRTLRYLKWRQVYYRLYYRLKKPKLPSLAYIKEIKLRAPILGLWQQWHPHERIVKSENLFSFLNEVKNISENAIWNDTHCSKLWLYNLHYFNYLLASSEQLSVPEKIKLLKRWIKENESIKLVGWEPYPCSLRIVNWIKFLLMHPYSDPEIEKNLFIQSHYLKSRLEYSILGNHLLANSKALIFAGLFFEGDEAEKLYRKGLGIYQKEIKNQILSDGGHFELSPMYHAIILEDILDIIQIHSLYGRQLKPEIGLEFVRPMLVWLRSMTHPDGQLAFFNDASFGIAPTYDTLLQYAKALKIEAPGVQAEGLYLSQTYCMLRYDEVTLFCDVGDIGPDYLPGHAHADSLSFELSLDNQRIFVNSGTSSYAENADRFYQRSTEAHNTIVVNHENSSEVWGSFRVGRRAKISDVYVENNEDNYIIQGTHNGYWHLGCILHKRSWSMLSKQLKIRDEVISKTKTETKKKLEVFFHFYPSIRLKQCNDFMIELYLEDKKIAQLEMDRVMEIFDSYFYPEFGLKMPSQSVKATCQDVLPQIINTRFTWT